MSPSSGQKSLRRLVRRTDAPVEPQLGRVVIARDLDRGDLERRDLERRAAVVWRGRARPGRAITLGSACGSSTRRARRGPHARGPRVTASLAHGCSLPPGRRAASLGGREPWRASPSSGAYSSSRPSSTQRSRSPPRLMSPRPTKAGGKRSPAPEHPCQRARVLARGHAAEQDELAARPRGALERDERRGAAGRGSAARRRRSRRRRTSAVHGGDHALRGGQAERGRDHEDTGPPAAADAAKARA